MKKARYIHPMGNGAHSYKVHGITFVVETRFMPLAGTKLLSTLRDRMTHSFKNGFAELPPSEENDNIVSGYACSEKREEDVN
ncbi:MAG: hypothetical protein K6G56_08070 [Clostridiales bacterium]|nr:hypothetical protein [Clostridiales bacterium]